MIRQILSTGLVGFILLGAVMTSCDCEDCDCDFINVEYKLVNNSDHVVMLKSRSSYDNKYPNKLLKPGDSTLIPTYYSGCEYTSVPADFYKEVVYDSIYAYDYKYVWIHNILYDRDATYKYINTTDEGEYTLNHLRAVITNKDFNYMRTEVSEVHEYRLVNQCGERMIISSGEGRFAKRDTIAMNDSLIINVKKNSEVPYRDVFYNNNFYNSKFQVIFGKETKVSLSYCDFDTRFNYDLISFDVDTAVFRYVVTEKDYDEAKKDYRRYQSN